MSITTETSLDSAVPKESNYLTKEEVGQAGKNLTIKAMNRQDVSPNNTGEVKTVVSFTQDCKPLILNQTNKEILKSFGWQTVGDCIGKTVNVYNDPTISFGGQITGGIRIRAEVPPLAGGADQNQEGDETPF